jgi:hypothetical protein
LIESVFQWDSRTLCLDDDRRRVTVMRLSSINYEVSLGRPALPLFATYTDFNWRLRLDIGGLVAEGVE